MTDGRWRPHPSPTNVGPSHRTACATPTTREETGLRVEAVESLDVFTRRSGAHGPHGQRQLPYRCRVAGGEVVVTSALREE